VYEINAGRRHWRRPRLEQKEVNESEAAVEGIVGRRRLERMEAMKVRDLVSLAVVSVVLVGAVGSARAADQWFMLSEETIKSADQGVTIKSQGGRWTKDAKQMRIGVEGADVDIKKVVLGWDNRPDDTITDIGVLKAGGKTTPKDAPGRKGRLNSVTVEYKIVSDAPTAVLKVEGYD
jgi:hypothetical protein